MVSTAEALESKYVSVDLVKRSVKRDAVIIGEGEYENTDFGRRLSVPVEYLTKALKLRLNKDSVKALDSAYGADTKHWVGKRILFNVTTMKGKEVIIVGAYPADIAQAQKSAEVAR